MGIIVTVVVSTLIGIMVVCLLGAFITNGYTIYPALDFTPDWAYCPNCGSCGECTCCSQSCEMCGIYEKDEEFYTRILTARIGKQGKPVYVVIWKNQ